MMSRAFRMTHALAALALGAVAVVGCDNADQPEPPLHVWVIDGETVSADGDWDIATLEPIQQLNVRMEQFSQREVDAAFERCDEISSLPDGNRELGRSDEYGDGIMKYVCYGADAEAYQAWLSAGP